MIQSSFVTLALGLLGLCLAGCTGKTEPLAGKASDEGTMPAAAKTKRVVIRVNGMTKVLGIT